MPHKMLNVFFLLLMIVTPVAFASEEGTQERAVIEAEQGMDTVQAYQAIFVKHTQITASCELDPVCIYEQAKKVLESTDDELMRTFFFEMVNEFENNKEAILSMEKKCGVPELKQTRKAISTCFPVLIDSFEKQEEESVLEGRLNNCLVEKLKEPAQADNPFAIGALMDVYENLGDDQGFEDLTKRMKAMEGSDLYQLYQTCQEQG